MDWADAARTLKVRTNADTPRDAAQAVKFGAEGIGLCRTEHMFFEGDRITAIREMIVAKTVEARKTALDKLLPYQQGDFEAMYRVLEGRPDDRSLSWIRRCTSSCPPEEEDIEELAERDEDLRGRAQGDHRQSCTSSTR